MRTARIHQIPLKRKLAMLMVVVMTASFCLSATITGVYTHRSERRAMEHHLDVLASAIGDNCSAALVFDDETAAAEILAALDSDRVITGALLTDESSHVVATFRNGPPPAGEEGTRMRVDRRITVDGDTVGYLTIWAETAVISGRLATIAVVGVTCFVVGVLVVLFLFERMLRVVTAPLVDLQETIRHVVRSRDYTIRAIRFADDEISDVAMAFNDLLAQIEEHTPAPSPATASAPAKAAEDRVRVSSASPFSVD